MPKDSLLWHENGAALLRVEAKSAPLWLSYLREDSAVAAADGIDHCNHDFARGGEHTRIKSPGFRDVHVDIRGA